jgi:hypothetical protein
MQQPSGILIGPVSGKGMAETFTVRFEDPRGAQTISAAGLIINTSLNHANACYVYYDPSTRQITLMDDTKALWLQGVQPGNGGQVQNAQCILDGAKSSVSADGTGLTIKAALTFSSRFTGEKKLYLYAEDRAGGKTGYLFAGQWTVTNPQ